MNVNSFLENSLGLVYLMPLILEASNDRPKTALYLEAKVGYMLVCSCFDGGSGIK